MTMSKLQSAAAATAAAWRHVPQLRELSIRTITLLDIEASRQDLANILAGLAAATSLTNLSLLLHADWPANDGEAAVVAACASLAGLTNLSSLAFEDGTRLAPGDVLALTALTGLTRLQLASMGNGVGTAAAVALARSLQQLQHLDLQKCSINLSNVQLMSAIGQLSQLTELRLNGNSGLSRQGLMQLAGLSQLRQLGVSRYGVSGDLTPLEVSQLFEARGVHLV
jgi:hypothetical protein